MLGATEHLNSCMTITRTILLYALLLLMASGCKKHKAKPALELLPPATQSGANTFGCLVNGQAFTPKGPSLSPILSCYYQRLYTSSSKGYFFSLSASDKSKNDMVFNVNINTDSLQVEEGQTVLLSQGLKGEASGAYYVGQIYTSKEYRTNSQLIGQLLITKLDSLQQIVSGTFWFDAVNPSGEKVEVREGRFDVRYTR